MRIEQQLKNIQLSSLENGINIAELSIAFGKATASLVAAICVDYTSEQQGSIITGFIEALTADIGNKVNTLGTLKAKNVHTLKNVPN